MTNEKINNSEGTEGESQGVNIYDEIKKEIQRVIDSENPNDKGKTTSKSTITQRAKAGTSTTRSSKITIIQSRKKDMFPHMGIAHKFPYYFEPMPEIADRLNKAWFDQYFGEERMKDHIRKHKLKSHQYKAYVNYWWLKETSKNSGT